MVVARGPFAHDAGTQVEVGEVRDDGVQDAGAIHAEVRPQLVTEGWRVSVGSGRLEHMFDRSGCAVVAETSALGAPAIDTIRREVSAALESPSGLDDVGRVDAIRALEKLACVVTAAQAQLSVELDTSQRDAQAADGVPAARRGRGVAHQVARARRESPHRGQRHLGLGKAVTSELPFTWRAWRNGHIPEWTATLIARETACLSREDRLAVDAEVAGDPARLERLGLGELVGALHAAACRIDPASVVARRRRAEADRCVTLRPAPDTMTWLTALMPVKAGVAAYAALSRAADSARAQGDPRTRGQVMADALGGRVLEGDTSSAGSPGVSLNLVMTDHDLFGRGDEPAYLDGYGPIPAELARELVADTCSRHEQIWLRRLYADPTTGELVSADARSRLFRGSLARFIRLRDRICRTPWCGAPIRHLDHSLGSAAGGPTSLVNAQGLCEACSYAKEAPRWRARPSPDAIGHEVETVLPTGHRYRSRPPPAVATIRRTPIRLDYILAG